MNRLERSSNDLRARHQRRWVQVLAAFCRRSWNESDGIAAGSVLYIEDHPTGNKAVMGFNASQPQIDRTSKLSS